MINCVKVFQILVVTSKRKNDALAGKRGLSAVITILVLRLGILFTLPKAPES